MNENVSHLPTILCRSFKGCKAIRVVIPVDEAI